MGIRRTKYLVEPGLQLKIISILGLVALAAAINICVLVFYHQEKISLMVATNTLSSSALALQLRDMNGVLMWKLLLTVLSMIALFIVIGSWLTHRIAGPFVKLRRVLNDHFDGRDYGTLTFRKDDEFKDVLEMIARLLAQKKG